MSLNKKIFVFKVKKTKKNSFIILNNFKGRLISYKSLKRKQIKDLKIKLTWGLVSILKKLKKNKSKIKFVHLYIQNVRYNLIQHIFNIFKTWNIQISFFKSEIPIPHNGCRLASKPRKRKKSRKKKI